MSDSTAVSLVHLPATGLSIARVEPGGGDAAVMCGFAFTSMLSVVLFLAGMPLISMGVLAITGVSTILLESALASRRRAGATVDDLEPPELIVSLESRDAYRAMVTAYGEIRRVLGDDALLRASQPSVVERCESAVRQCGRLAVLSNPLQRYLDAHDRAQTQRELDRLRARSETAAPDEPTTQALQRAITARTRQLETHDQILRMRDRIQARLDLVRASLESFSATIVKLRVAGEEQRLLASDSVIDELEGVDDELEVLEAELALEVAA